MSLTPFLRNTGLCKCLRSDHLRTDSKHSSKPTVLNLLLFAYAKNFSVEAETTASYLSLLTGLLFATFFRLLDLRSSDNRKKTTALHTILLDLQL